MFIAVGLAVTVACVEAASANAFQRYASTTGSGAACSAAVPCSLTQAIAGAGVGDEVIVNPGTYVEGAELDVNAGNVTVHGVAGQPRPVIQVGLSNGLTVAALNGTVRHLEVDQAGSSGSLEFVAFSVAFGGVVDDVIARGGAAPGFACFFRNVTVTNTICTSSGSAGTAVWVTANLAATTMTLRNVTAVSAGTSGTGILLQAFSSHSLSTTLVNTIAQGGSTGLSLTTDSSGGASSVAHISYSDISSRSTTGTGATIDDQGHNLTTAPAYANFAVGDLHEAGSSVTVDRGIDDPANGPVDLDGNPRALGPATDIGAYELPKPPTATTSPATLVHTTDAQLGGLVNPQGLSSTVSFQYGTSSAYGATTASQPAGSGRTSQTISTIVPNLASNTTYHYRVIATNTAGSTYGTDMTFTTATTQHTLTVARTGAGSGSVTSSPPGIDCGSSCSHAYTSGTPVTLTATPAPGSTFAGWSGGRCSGTGTCTLMINSDQTATATFSLRPVLSRLVVSPRAFALTGRLVNAHCVRATHANRTHSRCTRPIKLRISYTLNTPARVTITITRALPGRLAKGRCVTPTTKTRHHRACTRLIVLRGALTGPGKHGTNSLTLTGRIGTITLTPGNYRLTATPTESGRTGRRQTIAFTITS